MVFVAAAETAFAALLKPIMDGGFIERDAAMIKWAPGALVIIFLVRSLGSFSDQYCISRVSRYVVYDLRALMFDRMIRLPSRYHSRRPFGYPSVGYDSVGCCSARWSFQADVFNAETALSALTRLTY